MARGPHDPAALHDRFIGREYPAPAPVTPGVRARCTVREAPVLGRAVYALAPRGRASGWHVVFTHGGGFVHPLHRLHWDMIEALVIHTGASVSVPIYPLAPEHRFMETYALLEQVYRSLLHRVPAERIVLCGDSAGGNLALAQALHYRALGLPLPGRIVLFSPVLDYGFTYLGGLAEAARLGGADRARAVAGFLLCAALGFSLPPAALGFVADRVGVVPALTGFGAALLLAHAALAARR
ncbi:MAG TPA: alpha/beta hydrolase [Longimicrobium sp.]|nr:alpha/beta hydrolase [Longimicrobium sp.]